MKELDGLKLSKKLINEYKERIYILKQRNIIPSIAVILVGDNPQSKIYIKMKKKRCEDIGIKFTEINLNFESDEECLISILKKLNQDDKINGILIQLPLPNHIDKNIIIQNIDPKKDVDGFHINNFGSLSINSNFDYFVPCTPLGCIKLLEEYNIELFAKDVVVVGKSNIVGLPLALMLMHKESTVTVCHINTKNLKEKTKLADIIFVACGVPNLIKSDYIKENAIIVDVGINKININNKIKIVGDVDYDDCINKCKYITPVPGGIGPMTISMLINNLLISCENLHNFS